MQLHRPKFLNGRELFYFFIATLLILIFSLLIEYQNYTKLTTFSDTILDVKVLSQYKKSKKNRTYYVLKLALESGIKFYTTLPLSTPEIVGKKVKVWLLVKQITFYEYMKTFYLPSKIITIYSEDKHIKNFIKNQHNDEKMQELYGALFFAENISYSLRQDIAYFGVSHLIAISGFHLGILSFLLFLLFKPFIKMIYNRCCPYRHSDRDIFLVVASLLFFYMAYINYPPSLLRAFTMFVVGFILYDRGMKIISMQTLFVTVVLLLSLYPRLIFSLGFFLSVSGVFYIFLYLQLIRSLKNRLVDLLVISIWMYLMMLPYSIYFFHTFSIYHPLSIIVSMLFTLFYPLVLLLHMFLVGDVFDTLIMRVLTNNESLNITLTSYTFFLFMTLSLLSVRVVYVRYILIFYALGLLLFALSNTLK